MALIETHAPSQVTELLARPFRAFGNALLALTQAQQINREAELLFNMSDEELANRGLKREEIGIYLTRNYAHV